MGIFQRTVPAGDPTRFWSWWSSTGRELTTAALARGEVAGTIGPLGQAINDLHPEVSWELAPGELSEHVLVVTAAGNPDLRAGARRWLLAAPPPDETWSYSDHRLPRADPEEVTLSSETGPEVDFARFQITARKAGPRFDVVLHHPAFPDLAEPARLQIAYLALDLALGEYDVELWLGEIRATEHGLVDGFGLSALRSVVHDLKADHVDADGQPSWQLLHGDTPQGPLLALAQVPLHPVAHPHLSLYAGVLLPYAEQTPEGLPADGSLAALRDFEDHLARSLERDGRVVAHQTSAGSRLLHVYLDEASDALSRVRRAVRDWPEGRAAVESRLDPGWQAVAHLRG